AADINSDGKADLIAINGLSTWVMLSTGSGFSAPQLWSSTNFQGSVTTLAGDINGDGKADLIAVDAVDGANNWAMTSTGTSFSPPFQVSNRATTGFGLWPTSTTDPNGQTMTITYDALGRQVAQSLPGETSGLATNSTTYTIWCSGTNSQSPCAEVDKTQRLNRATTATYR